MAGARIIMPLGVEYLLMATSWSLAKSICFSVFLRSSATLTPAFN